MTERDALVHHGRDDFARGAYLAAHERWEAAWNLSTGRDKLVVQALAQLAAALVHLERGNRIGAERVLDKARDKLAGRDTPATVATIDVDRVRQVIAQLGAELAAGRTPDLATATLALR